MQRRIRIVSFGAPIKSVKELLDETDTIKHEVGFEMTMPFPRPRGDDPSILMALVGTAGTALGALIGGILRVMERTKQKKLVIKGRSGREIEVIGDVSRSELEQFVTIAKDLDVERIEIHP